jgi:hypothetical protein
MSGSDRCQGETSVSVFSVELIKGEYIFIFTYYVKKLNLSWNDTKQLECDIFNIFYKFLLYTLFRFANNLDNPFNNHAKIRDIIIQLLKMNWNV